MIGLLGMVEKMGENTVQYSLNNTASGLVQYFNEGS